MAEMLAYGADLTSMTQGRGSFNMNAPLRCRAGPIAGEDYR